jgi:hypothetical protein
MSSINKRCSLCFRETGDKDLVAKDSLQLCPKCYTKYEESPYNQRVMLLNSINCYRKLVERYEDTSGIKIKTDFSGIS